MQSRQSVVPKMYQDRLMLMQVSWDMDGSEWRWVRNRHGCLDRDAIAKPPGHSDSRTDRAANSGSKERICRERHRPVRASSCGDGWRMAGQLSWLDPDIAKLIRPSREGIRVGSVVGWLSVARQNTVVLGSLDKESVIASHVEYKYWREETSWTLRHQDTAATH